MTDDLERMLRAQAGPRERGYEPRQLPSQLMTPPAGPRLRRVAMFASAAAAGVLAVAIGAAVLTGGGPGDAGIGGGSTAPSASAAATPSSAPSIEAAGSCTPADIDLTAEPWGGAAGTRGTTVTVALRDGRYACSLGHPIGAWLIDSAGRTLVETEPMAVDMIAFRLDADHTYTVGVAWSEWCGDAVTGEITIHLRLLGPESDVQVVPDNSAEAVPPCLGDAPTSLSITGLRPLQ